MEIDYICVCICVYCQCIIFCMYTYEACEEQRWTSQQHLLGVWCSFPDPGTGQGSEVHVSWRPVLPEGAKTRVWQWWGGWNWYRGLQKQDALALGPGVLIMSIAKDWAVLYLPQVMFCKVLLRKKKNEQLEKISGITNQVSSEHSNHFFENPEKRHDPENLLQKPFY